jgi:type IV secretory pathway TrbL component
MKYLSLLLLSVLFIPLVQVAHAQNIIDQIGQAFNNLTSGMMGGNQTNQTSSNGSSAGSANQTSSNGSSAGSANQTSSNGSSAGSANQTSTDIGSIQELQNLTSGNQEILANNTSVAGDNSSLGQGMEREQYVEPENQSNALSSSTNNTQ